MNQIEIIKIEREREENEQTNIYQVDLYAKTWIHDIQSTSYPFRFAFEYINKQKLIDIYSIQLLKSNRCLFHFLYQLIKSIRFIFYDVLFRCLEIDKCQNEFFTLISQQYIFIYRYEKLQYISKKKRERRNISIIYYNVNRFVYFYFTFILTRSFFLY